MIALAAAASAAPVVCDPAEAARIIEDARIDLARAPVTHPELVPGLARGAADAELSRALEALCAPGGALSVAPGDAWGSAYTVVATRAEERGCSLAQTRVVLSVGIEAGGARWTLLDRPPTESTPLGDCDEPTSWREERVLAGDGGAVRVIEIVDRRGDEVVGSAIEARRASPTGWSRQTLRSPAPEGPSLHLGRTRAGEPLIVACEVGAGQTLWTWSDGGWRETSGRDALLTLALEGQIRLAGDAGWMLILAQDDEVDADLLGPRKRRLERRDPEALHVFSSSELPGLNPGFLVIAPAPWPTEEGARAARPRWRRGAYVKQAWAPVCE